MLEPQEANQQEDQTFNFEQIELLYNLMENFPFNAIF